MIDVGSGVVVTNSVVSLTGGLSVRKDGEGTYLAALAEQTYTNGTVVTAGTLQASADMATLFGASGSTITVEANGTFDLYHSLYCDVYPIQLNGGTLMNSGTAYGQKDVSLKTVTLGADSYWNSCNSLCFYAGDEVATTLDLGGHTLYVTNNTPSTVAFRLTNTTVTNGTLVVDGDGYIIFRGTQGVAYGATLDLKGQLGVYHKITHVGGLILRDGCTVYSCDGFNFSVAGTFKCETTNGFPLVFLKPNATWDLSENEGTFNSVNPLNDSWYIMMANNSADQTINIKLGDRAVRSGVPIVTWSKEIYTNTTYNLVETTNNYGLKAHADGLYATSGFILLVR